MQQAGKSARRRRRLLIRLAEAQDNLCFHCQQPMLLPDPSQRYENDARNSEEVASYDHLIPKSKNGQGGFNLVIAHRGCNSKRGQNEPTCEELEKLSALNERRKHLFTAEHGRISPGSFGEVTSSSIVLAEVLNNLDCEDANQQRRATCKFLEIFYQDLRAIDAILEYNDWFRIATLIRDHHIQKLYSEQCRILVKNFVSNVIHSLVKNRSERRRKVA